MSCLSTARPTMLRSRALWLHYMLETVSDDDHFDMRTFVQRRNGGISGGTYASFIGVTANWPWCNTASCIGGTILMLGYTAEQRGSPEFRDRGFSQIAAEWLGIDNKAGPDLSSAMFSPGPFLHEIKRHHAIAAVKKLYEDGVWWWRNVPDLERRHYSTFDERPGDRGNPLSVEWSTEPNPVVAGLFTLRDRVRKAYWSGKGSQPFGASLDNDVPVCLLTGIGAVARNRYSVIMAGEELRDALRAAVPPGTTFVHISDRGLDSALALVDKAILIRLGVLPAEKQTPVIE